MKRVLPEGGERKGCYPAAGKGVRILFFFAEKKKVEFSTIT